MSVQVMERNPQTQTAAAPEQYSQGGYEVSFGTYEIDESARTFTFHVEGALVRTLIGKDLPRAFEFSGRQLIVESTRPDERWKSCLGALLDRRSRRDRSAMPNQVFESGVVSFSVGLSDLEGCPNQVVSASNLRFLQRRLRPC